MKNLLITIIATLGGLSVMAQGSLIADIMKVEPVNITIGEENQKKIDEYDVIMEEAKAELEEDLASEGEDYAESITTLVTDFQDVLAEGEEQKIKNEKSALNSRANSLTFALIKDKKLILQRLVNKMTLEIRKLPRPVDKIKDKEMKTFADEYKDKFHEEFEANKRVLKAFQATEHVTKTHISEVSTETPSE